MNKIFLTYEQSQWLYIVWVGGHAHYYTTYGKAIEYYDEWVAQDYNDVTLQCWDTFHKKYRTICYTEKRRSVNG